MSEQRVWVVLTGDYNGDWVESVYDSESLAQQHVSEKGGFFTEHSVSSVIDPDVVDPERLAERQAEAEKARGNYEREEQIRSEQERQRANCRPYKGMRLCKCPVFEPSFNWINAYGYCTFCGGFTIAVFREHEGEEALRKAIDELAIHDRETMHRLASA